VIQGLLPVTCPNRVNEFDCSGVAGQDAGTASSGFALSSTAHPGIWKTPLGEVLPRRNGLPEFGGARLRNLSRLALETDGLFRRLVIEVRFAVHREQHGAARRLVVTELVCAELGLRHGSPIRRAG